jgi:hypothetical protein
MRPIVTTLLAIGASGMAIGNPTVISSSAQEMYPDITRARDVLFGSRPDAVKVEVWRHGHLCDEFWREKAVSA